MPIINDLQKGQILHGKTYDYEIVKALGQGSFGITYLASVKMRGELGAIDANLFVAIKEFFMHEVNGRDNSTVTCGSKAGLYDKYKQKFIKEAQNLSRLKHPNIIKVVESFELNNTVYYCMEFLSGGNLDELIAKKGSMSEDETLWYARRLASALQFMHSQNMLHLDLKPSNVMLKSDGEPVLIDFGLSKQYDESGNPESSTTIGGGTPGYAPVEQLNYRGDSNKGLPVTMDIYALGASMYKMLVGCRPPEASDILNDGFPSEELRQRGVSQQVQQLVERLMAPMRKDRPQSIAEVMPLLGVDAPKDAATAEECTQYAPPINDAAEINDAVKIASVEPSQPRNADIHTPTPTSAQAPISTPVQDNPSPLSTQDIASKSHDDDEPTPGKSSMPKIIGITLGAVCLLAFLWFIFAPSGAESTSYTPDGEQVIHVLDLPFTNANGSSYKYSGPVTLDSIPDGEGIGYYEGGRYKGQYVNGIRQGQGVYNLKDRSGNYNGLWHNDQYEEGTLTDLEHNMYFVGTFVNNAAYDGTLYSLKDSTVISKVREGKTVRDK